MFEDVENEVGASFQLAYAKWKAKVFDLTAELQDHPGFGHSEDLGDWVEMMSTLFSFAPHVRVEIERYVRSQRT